jgi:hypothetical protein
MRIPGGVSFLGEGRAINALASFRKVIENLFRILPIFLKCHPALFGDV